MRAANRMAAIIATVTKVRLEMRENLLSSRERRVPVGESMPIDSHMAGAVVPDQFHGRPSCGARKGKSARI